MRRWILPGADPLFVDPVTLEHPRRPADQVEEHLAVLALRHMRLHRLAKYVMRGCADRGCADAVCHHQVAVADPGMEADETLGE
uniref:Uncharacterized protein n=1 Tax=Candidatus Methanogaster sp. ANME-2c ERB4 TaxID=2759911 RepID=A0A7G9Y9T3_9EURY|nr:hypothetical protein GJEHNGGF_00004 [Methanosarcinales archaeon ANME-2c ERB4]QNO45147.1 hypothetical protein NBMHDOOP_00014 [Methanosarcinales archaeon ANME-2c ERB4]